MCRTDQDLSDIFCAAQTVLIRELRCFRSSASLRSAPPAVASCHCDEDEASCTVTWVWAWRTTADDELFICSGCTQGAGLSERQSLGPLPCHSICTAILTFWFRPEIPPKHSHKRCLYIHPLADNTTLPPLSDPILMCSERVTKGHVCMEIQG